MSDITAFALAEIGIRQLHARYIDSVWRKDLATFAGCFAEDGEWRIAGTIVKGREEAVTFMRRWYDDFKSIFIQLSTPVLDVNGATASGRTYFTARNIFKDGKPFSPMGTYYERFVREGDVWRFKWRLFQTHYVGAPDLLGTYNTNPDYGPPPAMPPLDALA